MFNMSTNKTYYQEAMRGHDRALSNLENLPQGFQHLVQMQKNLSSAESVRPGDERPTRTRITASTPSKRVSREPFPNPWARGSAGTRGLQALMEDMHRHGLEPDDIRIMESSGMKGEDTGMDSDRTTGSETGMATKSTPSLPPGSDLSQYSARFHRQLQVLNDLGFVDENENIRALLQTGGNVTAAIEWLVSRRSL